MEQEEKYVAILFEKFNYDVNNGIFLFKPIDVLSDCKVDFKHDILTSKTGNQYLSMDDQALSYSEENMCYGYPMNLNDLKNCYPEANDTDEVLKLYLEEISDTVYFGVTSLTEKRIKLILAHKNSIQDAEDEEWFYAFGVDHDNEIQIVDVDRRFFDKLTKCIDNNDFDTVKGYLNNINSVINNIPKSNQNVTIDEIDEIKESDKEEITNNNLDEVLKKLNDLVGLENVKKEVNLLIKYLLFIKKVSDKVNLPKPNLHMFFTGNPGTGKTTVARIIAEILYKLGYIKENKVAEITSRSLIGEYVGQTAPKTNEIIMKNKGGVIFIDEAYDFADEAQHYASQALVEIIKEMEKNETIFIFAGYKDEMNKFLKMNPGFASRIGYYVDYRDYDTKELYEMFINKVKASGMKINQDIELEKKILSLIDDAKKQEHFGNGRFIDKLFNKIILEHSLNTEKIDDIGKLITITESDISDNLINELLYNNDVKKQPMGFNCHNEKVKKFGD